MVHFRNAVETSGELHIRFDFFIFITILSFLRVDRLFQKIAFIHIVAKFRESLVRRTSDARYVLQNYSRLSASKWEARERERETHFRYAWNYRNRPVKLASSTKGGGNVVATDVKSVSGLNYMLDGELFVLKILRRKVLPGRNVGVEMVL